MCAPRALVVAFPRGVRGRLVVGASSHRAGADARGSAAPFRRDVPARVCAPRHAAQARVCAFRPRSPSRRSVADARGSAAPLRHAAQARLCVTASPRSAGAEKSPHLVLHKRAEGRKDLGAFGSSANRQTSYADCTSLGRDADATRTAQSVPSANFRPSCAIPMTSGLPPKQERRSSPEMSWFLSADAGVRVSSRSVALRRAAPATQARARASLRLSPNPIPEPIPDPSQIPVSQSIGGPVQPRDSITNACLVLETKCVTLRPDEFTSCLARRSPAAPESHQDG